MAVIMASRVGDRMWPSAGLRAALRDIEIVSLYMKSAIIWGIVR
jgi:hypothetical protein